MGKPTFDPGIRRGPVYYEFTVPSADQPDWVGSEDKQLGFIPKGTEGQARRYSTWKEPTVQGTIAEGDLDLWNDIVGSWDNMMASNINNIPNPYQRKLERDEWGVRVLKSSSELSGLAREQRNIEAKPPGMPEVEWLADYDTLKYQTSDEGFTVDMELLAEVKHFIHDAAISVAKAPYYQKKMKKVTMTTNPGYPWFTVPGRFVRRAHQCAGAIDVLAGNDIGKRNDIVGMIASLINDGKEVEWSSMRGTRIRDKGKDFPFMKRQGGVATAIGEIVNLAGDRNIFGVDQISNWVMTPSVSAGLNGMKAMIPQMNFGILPGIWAKQYGFLGSVQGEADASRMDAHILRQFLEMTADLLGMIEESLTGDKQRGEYVRQVCLESIKHRALVPSSINEFMALISCQA
jgi:hypothetical protein